MQPINQSTVHIILMKKWSFDLGMIAPEKVCHVVEIFWERVDNNNQDWPQIRNKKLEANMVLILMICCGHFHMLWATNQKYKKLQANMLLILMRCCGPFSVHPVMHQNFDHTIALQFLQHQTPLFVEDNPCRFWPSLSNALHQQGSQFLISFREKRVHHNIFGKW